MNFLDSSNNKMSVYVPDLFLNVSFKYCPCTIHRSSRGWINTNIYVDISEKKVGLTIESPLGTSQSSSAAIKNIRTKILVV